MKLAPDALRGSYPPLVTPFAGGAVDHATFSKLVERQVAEGSHGIVVCGTTSEATSLSIQERSELYRVAVETSAGRQPVVLGAPCGGERERKIR